MSFKPGKVVAALAKIVPDVGAAIVTALKTELLSKDEITLAEAAACLTKVGIPPVKIFAVRAELMKSPQPPAALGALTVTVCTPDDVVAAVTKVVPDVDGAVLHAVSTELLVKDELTLAQAVALLLEHGVLPAQVFDVREELASPPPAEVPPSTPVRCMQTPIRFSYLQRH